jgi:hypothetical protein
VAADPSPNCKARRRELEGAFCSGFSSCALAVSAFGRFVEYVRLTDGGVALGLAAPPNQTTA